MEFNSSDEEEREPVFWNNWLPSYTKQFCGIKNSNLNRTTEKRKVVLNLSGVLSVTSMPENVKFGNWIPPANFLNPSSGKEQNTTPKVKEIQFHRTPKNPGASTSNVDKIKMEFSKIKERNLNSSCTADWKKKINLDWGERVELNDVTKFNDGDLIWGFVNLGVFGSIKLWVNEYGNICCSANGKISRSDTSELTFISITNNQLLRKMLNLSSAQWGSLCETLLETKTVLNFDAFQNCDLTRLSTLEKLWIFICKRRHFLPRQCMLVKFSGAVKCMKKFKITPKLIVQDIRNVLGEPIL